MRFYGPHRRLATGVNVWQLGASVCIDHAFPARHMARTVGADGHSLEAMAYSPSSPSSIPERTFT